MRSSLMAVGILAAALAASACGGGDDGGSTQTPTNPGPSNPTTPTNINVSIVGTLGNRSYVPNPVSVSSDERVVFKNDSTETHRIVMDDNSVDFGTLSPGVSSAPRAVSGGSFHCTQHPSMVGSFNTTTAPEPPPGSGDGY